MAQIVIIASSDVMNRKLSESIKDALEKKGSQVVLINLVDEDLPLFTTKFEAANGIPKQVESLSQKLSTSTGIIFVAPEYNGSYPPAHNNFIAWMSRSSKEWRELFNDKAAGIATHSGGGGTTLKLFLKGILSITPSLSVMIFGKKYRTCFMERGHIRKNGLTKNLYFPGLLNVEVIFLIVKETLPLKNVVVPCVQKSKEGSPKKGITITTIIVAVKRDQNWAALLVQPHT